MYVDHCVIFRSSTNPKKDVIDLAKPEVEDVYKRLVEKKSVPTKNQTTMRTYCVAILMYMHNQSPKRIAEFKVSKCFLTSAFD